MNPPAARPAALTRTFAVYAAIIFVPVLAIGFAFAASYRAAANQRGLAEGRSEATIVAQSAIEPVLGDRPLTRRLTTDELADLRSLVIRATADQDILRLRLRNLAGKVVYSSDGSGFGAAVDPQALLAAKGQTIAQVTRLNADDGDSPTSAERGEDAGSLGPDTVEVYLPLTSGPKGTALGVLEVYLPYAPINGEVTGELAMLYRNLAVGLFLLYLALVAITISVSRGLRRQSRWNAFLAERDGLTRLPNRVLFQRRAEGMLTSARQKHPVAIAIVDLDRFKEVNDTLGHRNGDSLLAELAHRLTKEVQAEDMVARLGGDEFGIILANAVDAERTLRRLRNVIQLEILVSGVPLSVEASIGYVIAPEDGAEVDELLQRADIAMYVAKAQHSGVVRYDACQNTYDAASLGLISEVRRAIEASELVLHYQPKTSLTTCHVEAVEALVRWEHPQHGLLLPGRFVPLVEQTDLIGDLTMWVIDQVLDDIHLLPPNVAAAVNISARNLTDPDFAALVVQALERHGVPAHRLIVEVTETALLVDPLGAASILGSLASRGVRISIDDFGSGQTSLGYLSTLPIHELKIDRSFVFDMLDDPSHAAIVRSIVDLGHNLSLRVVGEGVESASVLRGLSRTGCDEAQGFFLARPMPVTSLLGWLREADKHPAVGALAGNSLGELL